MSDKKQLNVYQKLNEARDKFHQSELKKSGHNKFAGYSYFELGDFVVPALRIFKEVGLTSVISFGKEEAIMVIFNADKPDESIHIITPMSEASLKGCHAVQNLGAVQTYLRRYLWVTAMEIVEHDQLDATTGDRFIEIDDPVNKSKPVNDPPAKKIIANRYEETNFSAELFLEAITKWGNACESVSQLTELWKANQSTIDVLKKDNSEMFKHLQEHFAKLKNDLKGE